MCLSVSSSNKQNSLHSSNYRQNSFFAAKFNTFYKLRPSRQYFPHSREIYVLALTHWMSNVSVSLVHFQL